MAYILSSGVLTPSGRGIDALWESLIAGRAQNSVESFSYADRALRLPVAKINDFEPRQHFAESELRRLDRHHQLGMVAARDAVSRANRDMSGPRTGLVIGTVNGSIGFMEEQFDRLRKSYTKLTPLAVQVSMRSSLAAIVAREFGITGPVTTVTTECATGLSAAITGAEWIALGKVDRVLVGGVDASLTAAAVAFFARMRAINDDADEPSRASRPFDETRKGFVLGEGAAFAVLEAEELTSTADTSRLGRLAGWCEKLDIGGVVLPDQTGEVLGESMAGAIAAAGLQPQDIVSVNAHGTSTPGNDVAEATAIERVVGASVPITAVKGVTGHMLGASGLVELLVAARSAQSGVVPPVANTTSVDPAVSANVVVGSYASTQPGPVLCTSLGFGGFAVSAVVSP